VLADRRHTLVTRLSDCDRVVEVGVGRRPGVAAALAERGVDVTATDVRDRSPPEGVRFVRDDVTDPDLRVYRGVDALYARHCPPELQRPARDVARAVGAPFLFTTLGGDPALVEARRVNAGDGTVFVADAESGPTAE
jgi:uncharacterized UPF0146 family protein